MAIHFMARRFLSCRLTVGWDIIHAKDSTSRMDHGKNKPRRQADLSLKMAYDAGVPMQGFSVGTPLNSRRERDGDLLDGQAAWSGGAS